jgi:hypothetical protein
MATTTVAPKTMRAAQISKAGSGFQMVDRDIPVPTAGEVRIKVKSRRFTVGVQKRYVVPPLSRAIQNILRFAKKVETGRMDKPGSPAFPGPPSVGSQVGSQRRAQR